MKKLIIILATVANMFFASITYADTSLGRGMPTPSDIDKAIQSDPNNADLYNIRGNKYLLSKDFDKAIFDFSKAIQINPNYAEPYNGLGIAYRNIGQINKALENYTRAINLYPSYFEAYNNRGVAYLVLKNYENMCSDFGKACRLGSCEILTSQKAKGLCK